MNSFRELDLIEPLQLNVANEGYETPTPIQVQAIPPVLAGRDLCGCAQTGTGKTAAFALPLLQHLHNTHRPLNRKFCRALIVTPTRELAIQIDGDLARYGKGLGVSHALVYGGVSIRLQIRNVAPGVDIVVATPGRLLDLRYQNYLRFEEVEVLVLDEADRMLDMGFYPDIQRLLERLPRKRQTMFFSATMHGEAKRLADQILIDPVSVSVAPSATLIEQVQQRVIHVEPLDKRPLLLDMLADQALQRVLVFCRTKHGANKLARQLIQDGVSCDAIHGNKSQSARQEALESFRDGATRVLVATDIAARGLDVEGISHVINYDLPVEPEGYVHRIGRTARAGETGVAVSFCCGDDRGRLFQIERLIRQRIPVHGEDAAQHGSNGAPSNSSRPRRSRNRGRSRNGASLSAD